MNSKPIIQLQGSVSLTDVPTYTARPLQVNIRLNRPGTPTHSKPLAYQIMAYTQSPLFYRLQIDARDFEVGEMLELTAFVTAGYGEEAEKARVTLPLTLGHDKPNVECNLVIPGRTTPANSTRIGGTLVIPPIENLSDHYLTMGLYEVVKNDTGSTLYHKIVDCDIPRPALQTPFSLYFDETALTYGDTSHDVIITLRAPNGPAVASGWLRKTVPTELGQDLQITLQKRS